MYDLFLLERIGMDMNVMFVVDDHYIEQCLVTMHSLFVNNGGPFNIYVITSGLKEKNIRILKRFVEERKGRLFLKVYTEACIDTEKMVNRIWNPIVYFKLYGMFDITGVDRILYLDCDLIIDADLSELYQVDFRGNYAAVIEDSGLCQVALDYETHLKQLMIKDKKEYFNGGVMLLNLKKIQKEMSLESMVAQFDRYADFMVFNEQDLLNMLWNGKVVYADPRFNRVASDFRYRRKIGKDRNVVIYHYVTNKPWIKWRGTDVRGYEWCVRKYLQYCNLPETQNLFHQVKKVNRGLETHISGWLKTCLGYNPNWIVEEKNSWKQFVNAILFYRE